MNFKVTARTILQLGAELISSDAIAFYELIKNAFDANSPKVEVRIAIRLPFNAIDEFRATIVDLKLKDDDDVPPDIKQYLLNQIDREAFEVNQLLTDLQSAHLIKDFEYALKKANYIQIKDKGDGMSMADLESVYLTIGTRSRQKARLEGQKSHTGKGKRPILGEKGLGRLSVMRLGDGLRVETTIEGESHFNVLEIDWTIFSHDSDTLLENIQIQPITGDVKEDTTFSGTTIRIFDLHSNWSKEKLEDVASKQLNRFIDPFVNINRNFIVLWFNKDAVILRGVNKDLLTFAHATLKARLEINELNEPKLIGAIDYKLQNSQRTFELEGVHLISASSTQIRDLKKLGPFSVELYWYNRKLLNAFDSIRIGNGVEEIEFVKKLQNQWAGGLMLFRDGFRVNPYGSIDDDWLNIDQKALSVGGYKLNRRQIIGKVDITSIGNPNLVDQTNREGLRDNIERESLINILKHIIWQELKPFLDASDKNNSKKKIELNFADIETRIETGQRTGKQTLDALIEKYPVIKQETAVLKSIEEVLDESRALFKNARELGELYQDRLNTTIHLAGLGLMVDIVAHELNRSTQHAIETITEIGDKDLSIQVQSLMGTLRSQLKTLQTRLKVLDTLGPSGRQRKEETNINHLIYDTVLSHEAQFKRHKIEWFVDSNENKEWVLKVVPGMIVQVLENLINNSVYWLQQQGRVLRDFKPIIRIQIQRENKRILISDNGPGIPLSRAEEVFFPFVTTKPPNQGKGLGLYISREIAHYHNADLFLLQNDSASTNEIYLHTFVLDLKQLK